MRGGQQLKPGVVSCRGPDGNPVDVTLIGTQPGESHIHGVATGAALRHFRLPDLIIAAAAELSGATVLHYDADFDRIAEITGQAMEWIAPNGSLQAHP